LIMDWLRRIKKAVPVILVLSGSFMIAYGWGSYHFNVHDRWYIAKLWLFGVGMAVIFFVGKKISQKTTRRYQANWFWRDIADQKMEQMFFISALAFGIFLFRRELPSLIYMACWGALFFGFSRSLIQRHPQARPWLAAHGQWFWLGAFIFLLEAIWQYTAYRLYILDVNIRFFNIVLFRAIAMTVFWLGLAAGLHLISSLFKNILRHLGLGAWFVIFIFYSLVWTVNIAILYYSGLYISPIALQHAEGAGSVAINRLSFFLIATFIVAAIIIFSILRRWVKERSKATVDIGDYDSTTHGRRDKTTQFGQLNVKLEIARNKAAKGEVLTEEEFGGLSASVEETPGGVREARWELGKFVGQMILDAGKDKDGKPGKGVEDNWKKLSDTKTSDSERRRIRKENQRDI